MRRGAQSKFEDHEDTIKHFETTCAASSHKLSTFFTSYDLPFGMAVESSQRR